MTTSLNSSLFKFEEEKEDLNVIYKNKEITSISIDLLIKKIAVEDSISEDLVNHFIQQYHCFIPTNILIEKLFNAFNLIRLFFYNQSEVEEKVNYPCGIVKFLNQIILMKYQDEIQKDLELVQRLKEFYRGLLLDDQLFSRITKEEIESFIDIFEQSTKFDVEFSIKSLLSRKRSHNIQVKLEMFTPLVTPGDIFDVNQWPPLEVAKQLTLISQKLFSKIEYKELLSAKWTKTDKKKSSPNVMRIIERFNSLTFFIVEEILSYDKKRMRAQAIEKFILIANELKAMRNFNDCMNIVSALNNFILKGMKKTWKRVSKESVITLSRLNKLCSYDNNYANLRTEINNSLEHPCIPYLGLILKELAFIEEGPKYTMNDYLLNLGKIKNVARLINFFFDFKSRAYLFREIKELANLSDPQPKTERELEEIAEQLGKSINLYIIRT